MLVPAGLRLVGAYAAASEESPAKLAALARQLGGLLPPHLVRAPLLRQWVRLWRRRRWHAAVP